MMDRRGHARLFRRVASLGVVNGDRCDLCVPLMVMLPLSRRVAGAVSSLRGKRMRER